MTILDVDTKATEGRVEVVLKGELDLSTIDAVEQELARVEADDPALILLDLSALTFCDSTGLRAIMTADQRARRAGRRMVVLRGPDPVHRVFTITKLDERLEMVESTADISPS